MGVFGRSVGSDVLLSAEYIKVLLQSGAGAETIVYELSKKRFGRVTALCRALVQEERNGISVRQNLEGLSERRTHPYIRRLFTAMLSETKEDKNLSNLSETILSDRALEIELLIRRIDTVSDWLIWIPLVPVVVLLFDFFSQTVSDIPGGEGFNFGSLVLPERARVGILVITAIVLFILMLSLRFRKK